jgi:hypothetical protein
MYHAEHRKGSQRKALLKLRVSVPGLRNCGFYSGLFQEGKTITGKTIEKLLARSFDGKMI